MPTYEEWQEAHIKEQQEVIDKQRKENEKPGDPIEGGPGGAETEKEGIERANAVRSTMIFGDTDTIAGDVVSSDNEAANVAVAEADAEGADVSKDEARRQVDVAAGTTASAEEVEAGADDKADEKPAAVKRSSRSKND